MAAAGHRVTFSCRREEARLINSGKIFVQLSSKEGQRVAIGPSHCAFPPQALAPVDVNPRDYDLVCLAMQEPQYSDDGVRQLVHQIGLARIPCLSIMNMTLPPFLGKLTELAGSALNEAFTEALLWQEFEPQVFTMASADPQAKRLEHSDAIVIDVTLPTNFKVAPFEYPEHQAMLQRLARDIDECRITDSGECLQPRVRLCPNTSPFIPMSKWPSLITGNFRCLGNGEPISIAEAVGSDLDQSREIYEWVMQLCLAMGVEDSVLVPFDRYRSAAEGLSLPSSLARALHDGAIAVERVDKLIQALASCYGMNSPVLDAIVDDVDDRLLANRTRSGQRGITDLRSG